jgi:Na+/phosphate symporter
MSYHAILLQVENLPPAVAAVIISVLGFAFLWFFNRSIARMDKSFDKFEEKMDHIEERLNDLLTRLTKHDLKREDHESRILKLEQRKNRGT